MEKVAEKVATLLIAAGLYWVCIWGCAADTEGDGWWIVVGMVIIGLILMTIGLFVGLFADGEEE